MSGYVMFRAGPTIRGEDLEEVKIAAEAYIRAKVTANSGTIVADASPNLVSWLLDLRKVYPDTHTYQKPDFHMEVGAE